jgi:hypothetical protein
MSLASPAKAMKRGHVTEAAVRLPVAACSRVAAMPLHSPSQLAARMRRGSGQAPFHFLKFEKLDDRFEFFHCG